LGIPDFRYLTRYSEIPKDVAGAFHKGFVTPALPLALNTKYHTVLLSLAAFKDASNHEILEHCRTIAEIKPVVGFYLQPAVGGRILDAGQE
jgi:hypothetical protein